jgi:protein SCO1
MKAKTEAMDRVPHFSPALGEVGISLSSVSPRVPCGEGLSPRLLHPSRFSKGGIIGLVLLLTLLTACHSKSPQPATKRYAFKGRVVSIDSQDQSAVIDGEAVPGFMSAMAMSYKIKPASTLSQLAPGDSISADVVVVESTAQSDNSEPDYWLENVKVTARATAAPASTSSLHMPSPGEDVPDFAFTNQSGRPISLSQYRGKVLLVTFIYTRCPFSDFCPIMSSNFAQINQRIASDPSLAGIHLLSISFDPEHDTPRVLRNYGFSVAHTRSPALFDRWEFAAPTAADLPKIADFFALKVTPDGGFLTHNLSTTVISRDGKIVTWYHRSDWQVSDLIKDATTALAAKSSG